MREQILELGTAGACTLVICNAAYFLGAFVFVWFGVLGAQKGKPRPAPTPPAPEPLRTKTLRVAQGCSAWGSSQEFTVLAHQVWLSFCYFAVFAAPASMQSYFSLCRPPSV